MVARWSPAGAGWLILALLAGSLRADETPIQYPKVHEWDFETLDDRGQEQFSKEAVPVYWSDERPSQRHWRQQFGTAASSVEPDRFPRHTPAYFVRDRQVIRGNRALRLQSEGDNLLVSLANESKVKIFGEAEVTFRGWVRSRGLRHGSVRIVLRFFRDGYEIAGSRLISPPIRSPGAPGASGAGPRILEQRDAWNRYLFIQDRAPTEAEEFDIQILLDGSFEDERATVWLDHFEVEIMPGCRLAWPGRSNLLIQPGEPVELQVECFGLNRGTYRVKVSMRRTWPAPGGNARELKFESSRYVSSSRVPLRLLEDLRARFFLVEEDLGPGLYQVQVDIIWQGEVISSGSNEFAWIGSWGESTPTPTVRLGWIFPFENEERLRFDEVFHYQNSGFPLHQVLLDLEDWSPVRRSLTQNRTSVEDTLANLKTMVGGDASISWSVRIQWGEEGTAAAWRDFFLAALPELRMWHIQSDRPLTEEESRILVELKKESPILEFGFRPDARGNIPKWAQFRVVEIDPDRPLEWGPSRRPGPKDWGIIRLPDDLEVEERVAYFGRSVIDLTQKGFRRIFLKTAGDFFQGPMNASDEFVAPDPYLLAWIGTGRFLARSNPRKDYDWSPSPENQGVFRLFDDYGKTDTLVVYSRDEARFDLDLWTGEPVRGSDLLGSQVDIPFDPETGISSIPVNPVPKFLFPLPTGKVETALTLRRLTESLRPWPRTQSLSYQLSNRLPRTVEVDLTLEVQEADGWKARSLTGSKTLMPFREDIAEEELRKTWQWEVDLPQPTPLLKDYPFRVVMRLSEDGRDYRYTFEDSILLGSDVVEVSVDPIALGSHSIHFRLLNIWNKPLRLQVFSRILGGEQAGLSRIWSQVSLPRVPRDILAARDPDRLRDYSRELVFSLPHQVRALDGEEVWIGFQVGGRGDFNTFSFRVLVDESGVRLER